MFNLKGEAIDLAQQTTTNDKKSKYSLATTLPRYDAPEGTSKVDGQKKEKKEKKGLFSKLAAKKNEFIANTPAGRSKAVVQARKDAGKKDAYKPMGDYPMFI